MRYVFAILTVLTVISASALEGCKSQEGVTAGNAVIKGIISDASSGKGIYGVTVFAASASNTSPQVSTDTTGFYSLEIPIDSAASVTVSFKKSGYRDTAIVGVLVKVNTVALLNVILNPKSNVTPGGGTGTGNAQTIAFLGANPQEVQVYGVGGQETSVLGWEVRDSLGLPIDLVHAVSLTFTIVSGPGGQEYVSPATLTTNANGQAYTTFNAGVRAGVAQVVASTTVPATGTSIKSSPTRVVINGGFPDQAHFTIAPMQFNFPAALNIAGLTDAISIIVGDKYSNPVAKNTAVYFRSSAGVIQPSVFTDQNGQGSVNLISGNPLPFGQYSAAPSNPSSPLDTAYHYVVARTIGENGAVVQDSVLLLWSGYPVISNLNPPGSFVIDSTGAEKVFTFSVSDGYGHPLGAGTTITVTATLPPPPPNTTSDVILLSFGNNGTVVLKDAISRGPGLTDFSFSLADGNTALTGVTPVTVTISVSGPNAPNGGSVARTFTGILQ